MRELIKEDYELLKTKWEGILVAVPKPSLAISYDSELYIYSKYINHINEEEYHRIDYNKEDSSMFATCILKFNDIFSNFNDFYWYQFENLEDFCSFYLKRQGYKISRSETKTEINMYKKITLTPEAYEKIEEIDRTPLTDEEKRSIKEFKEKVNKFYEKEWIHEKCGTNTPPKNVPTYRSKGNKLKNSNEKLQLISNDEIKEILNPEWKKRKNKYKDIIKYIKLYFDYRMAEMNHKTVHEIKPLYDKVEEWLNEEEI